MVWYPRAFMKQGHPFPCKFVVFLNDISPAWIRETNTTSKEGGVLVREGDAYKLEGSLAAALRQRPFGMIWAANVFSNVGGQIQTVAASWLMLTMAGSPQMVALIQTASALPTMLFALFAGAIADTFDRRRVMLTAQAGMMITAALLAALAYLDQLTPVLLLVLVFVTGIGTAFNLPAWHASVGDMLKRNDLAAGISLNAAGFNVSRSVGPAIGGLIVSGGGAPLAFAVNAASYGVLISVLTRWRKVQPASSHPRERLDRAIRTGLGYVIMSPASRAVLVRGFVFSLGACAPLALLPSIVGDLIGGDAAVFGVLLAGFGLGAVSAALLGVRLRRGRPHEVAIRSSMSLIAAAIFVVSISDSSLLTGGALALAGAGWSFSLTTFNTNLQSSIPRWVVGRTLALYQTGNAAGVALGAFAWGAIATEYGLRLALAVSAAVVLLCVGIGLVRPLARNSGDEHDPVEPPVELSSAIPLRDSHGPVRIFVRYEVPRSQISEFKALMAKQRRIRLRDGAVHWSLLRDIEDHELWIEQFEISTWTDYLRHRDRLTKADQPLAGAIAAIVKISTSPLITRTIKRWPRD